MCTIVWHKNGFGFHMPWTLPFTWLVLLWRKTSSIIFFIAYITNNERNRWCMYFYDMNLWINHHLSSMCYIILIFHFPSKMSRAWMFYPFFFVVSPFQGWSIPRLLNLIIKFHSFFLASDFSFRINCDETKQFTSGTDTTTYAKITRNTEMER